jgi:glycosyltransferase involved in cell wall biosynthesis
MQKKVIVFFSEVIDSPIYKSLILRLSKENIQIQYVFIGSEAEPLFEYALSLNQDSRIFHGSTKQDLGSHYLHVVKLTSRFRPKIILAFGQTATLLSFASSPVVPNTCRIYFRGHTSMNKVEKFWRGRIYDYFSNRLANLVVVSNENTRHYLINHEKVLSSKIRVIPFGFDLTSFSNPDPLEVEEFKSSYDISSGEFLIGIVSRNSVVKGLDYSLKAVSKFLNDNNNAMLLLAGVGDIRNSSIQKIVDSIKPTQIRVIPRTASVNALFKSLDVFIHTPINSVVESYGLVYVEAFASGVASIVTLSGIANEIAVDGQNCCVVDFECDSQILAAIEELHKNSEKRALLGSNAKVTVSQLTQDNMCDAYVDLFNLYVE